MSFKTWLLERTMSGEKAQTVARYFQRLAYTNLYTKAEHETFLKGDVQDMPYSEYQLAMYEHDFDTHIQTDDPERVSFNKRGLYNLGFALKKLKKNHTDDENDAALRKWLDAVLKPMGWFVFRIDKHLVMLDPLKQQPINVPATIYHVTSLRNKDRIVKRGLIPSKGRYNMDYMYPPRVHVFLDRDFDAMRELATQIFNHGRSTESVYFGRNDIDPIVIFGIETDKLRPGTKFYEDASVEHGAWTYTHIPPEAIYIAHEDDVPDGDDLEDHAYGKGW